MDLQMGNHAWQICLEFSEDITSSVYQGEPVDVVYLDVQKAFNKISHYRLLCKVKAHGISGNVLRWIGNWLADRKLRVGINVSFSDWQSMITEVVQGSVLRPHLFIWYVNHLEEGTKCIISKVGWEAELWGRCRDASAWFGQTEWVGTCSIMWINPLCRQ